MSEQDFVDSNSNISGSGSPGNITGDVQVLSPEARAVILREQLFGQSEMSVYAVLDAASIPGLESMMEGLKHQHCCLFSGDMAGGMAKAAPYLAHLAHDDALTDMAFNKGWGNAWGIYALIPKQVEFQAVRKHFRMFLMVRSPQGEPIYFRYYDPRVFRVYLPTCTAEEGTYVFGPVQCYFMESEEGDSFLRFEKDKKSPDRLK